MTQRPASPAETPADGARPLDTRELEGAVGLWLRLAQQQDLKAFNRLFAPSGFSQLLYSVLLVVAANPGCRQADLGAVLRIRQPNLVEPIDTLVERGLVRRRPDPRDRRAQTLSLTRTGRTVLGVQREAHEGLIDSYRARLGEDGYQRLVELLRLFVDGAGGEPGPTAY